MSDMSGVWSCCWFFYPTVSDGIPQLAWQIVHSHGDFREAIQCQYNFLIKRLRPGSCAIHTICLWKVFQQVSTCELERISLGQLQTEVLTSSTGSSDTFFQQNIRSFQPVLQGDQSRHFSLLTTATECRFSSVTRTPRVNQCLSMMGHLTWVRNQQK